MNGAAAQAAIEAVARTSYGRLVAFLAARSGDVAGAEDALSDAFVAALRRWPEDGVPDNPEGWLLRAARNRTIDAVRHRQVQRRSAGLLEIAAEAAAETAEFPDERLKLLLVCAHPAIDPAARTPLMLQAVLGVEAARIASAFLVSPAAMAQRLVRAKTKIKEAGIPFRVPEATEWDERLAFVLDAIYAAYTAGFDGAAELAGEAIALGRLLVQLRPNEPEALGLLALMLHCEARHAARTSETGAFVPLNEQDPAKWDAAKLAEAEACLRRASALNKLGRFQLEAAIQSLHAARAHTGQTDWPAILHLYEGLLRLAPSIGAQVGRAVAQAESGHPNAALASLDGIPPDRVAAYQPYWATRAHVERMLAHPAAKSSLERAIGLTENPALRRFLASRE